MKTFFVSTADYKVAMNDAVAMSRWNAAMSIILHQEAGNYLQSFEEIELWNAYAAKINHTIDNITSQKYFKDDYAASYWNLDTKKGVKYTQLPTTRIEYI